MYGKTEAGVGLPVLVDSSGKLITAPGGGKYADAAINGRLFSAANQTPVNTSTTLNTTFTGLALANPTGSGKLLVLHEFGWALDQAAAGDSVLALGITTYSANYAAAITPRCARYAYATSVAVVDDGATIVAPVLVKIIGSIGTNATTALTNPGLIDIGGSIVLSPGYVVVTDTTLATGATSIQFHFMWEEVDA
jgi:hypothetical protein